MMQLVEANWPILLAAFLIGLLVAFLVWRSTRRTVVRRDPAEEGDGGARRNQALIDAPPVASGADHTPAPGAIGGAAVAAAVAPGRDEDGEASRRVDAPPHHGAAQPAPEEVENAATISQAANTDAVAAAGAEASEEAGATPPAREAIRKVPADAAKHPPGGGEADDLTRIKGVGPKLAAMLAEHGVTRFEQIAGWDDADVDRIDAQLGRFQGRIRRDDWRRQAQLLSAGDNAAYESEFGRL